MTLEILANLLAMPVTFATGIGAAFLGGMELRHDSVSIPVRVLGAIIVGAFSTLQIWAAGRMLHLVWMAW